MLNSHGAETNARDPRQGTPLAKAHSHTPVTATLGVWGVVPTTRTTKSGCVRACPSKNACTTPAGSSSDFRLEERNRPEQGAVLPHDRHAGCAQQLRDVLIVHAALAAELRGRARGQVLAVRAKLTY